VLLFRTQPHRKQHGRPLTTHLTRVLLAVSLLSWADVVSPQVDAEPADGRGRGGISGAVLDAGSGAPLEGATVLLQPEVIGAFPAGPASGSPFAAAVRAVLSDRAGGYRFDDLPAGMYRIYVTRFGYRPYSVVVELRGAASSPVGIGLAAEPIPLQPVVSTGHSRGLYESARTSGPDLDMARLVAAEQRRRKFLTTDSRELTHADVIEAVTLGEPDVLRALQRLPGVSTRSDYTAELWTRGAPWSHTRVYFDGIPLFNPLHALGIVSGIGSNAIGAVWFHPGTRPASMGEGAAGVIDLQSRRASGAGELNVNGDLSLVSAGLALDQRVLDGRAGWMLAGRRTYIDWLSGLARHAGNQDDGSFPYGFSEVTGRVDAWVGERSVIEASWLWERDYLTSTREADPLDLRADWGNTAGRVSFTTRAGGLNIRHTVAASAHDSQVLPDAWREAWRDNQVPSSAFAWRLSESGVAYTAVSGTVWPEPATLAGPRWSAGYAFERHTADYTGPQVLPVPRQGGVAPPALETGSGLNGGMGMRWSAALPMAVAWGEHTLEPVDGLGVRVGVRVEASEPLANMGPVRFAPRLSARYAVSSEVALSAGLARVFQYTQALGPGGVHIASLISTDAWLVAGPYVPAISSDIATAGLEAWLAPGRVFTMNVSARHAAGLAVSDPRPGRIFTRPMFVHGENRAYGLELSARQITGTVTGAVSYTLSKSEMAASGLRYPAAADRRHVLSTTAMLRLASALRVGAAYTAATGVPFTRAVGTVEECANEPGCDPQQLPWMGEPHESRAPTFASLDLLFDWSRRVGSVEIGAYAQLRNALGRENATVYTGNATGCTSVGCGDDLRSEYERGVPRLPIVGLRVRH
jgi:hypothetical protein